MLSIRIYTRIWYKAAQNCKHNRRWWRLENPGLPPNNTTIHVTYQNPSERNPWCALSNLSAIVAFSEIKLLYGPHFYIKHCVYFFQICIESPVRLVESDVIGGESNTATTQTHAVCAYIASNVPVLPFVIDMGLLPNT